MKTNTNRNKSGGILVMAMVVLVALTLLASGLLKLKESNAIEGVNVEQSAQAFWLAESGLQHVIQRLNFDPVYRGLDPKIDPAASLTVTKTVDKGNYSAWLDAKEKRLAVVRGENVAAYLPSAVALFEQVTHRHGIARGV